MNIEAYRNFCLELQGVKEDFPFDENTLVFKVKGKMFCAFNIESFNRINLKCNPQKAIDLREEYSGIKPGYHMNKKHWNSLYLDQDIPSQLLKELTTHSYELVVKSLTKKAQKELLDD